MIHLEKPNDAPPVLLNRGATENQKNCEAYIKGPARYDTGELKFNIKQSIYGSSHVREALMRVQHGKCCYCESKAFATSASRIDHFRPHGAVRQGKGSRKLYPGYYWLAYRWDNLVISCEKCNRMKSDCFPLEECGQRVRNHLGSLDSESPLLLNPYTERNLSEHVAFEGSDCRPGTDRGRVTVTVLGLNRPELQEQRQYQLSVLATLCAVERQPNVSYSVRCQAKRMIESFARPDAPYSAMVRDYLGAGYCSSDP